MKKIIFISLLLSSCSTFNNNKNDVDLINNFKPSQINFFCDLKNKSYNLNCVWLKN